MDIKRFGVIATSSLLVVGACTSGTSPSASTGASSGAQPSVCQNKKGSSSSEIHVYSSLPLQGTNTPQTSAMVNEIKATLDGQKVGNFTIKYTSLDDSSAAQSGNWDGTVEQSNANKAANDPDAMVYIGTFNSGAAKLSIPILNSACLVMISPANSYPGLTKAVTGVTQPGEPDSYYPNGYRNYSRVINTDDNQGGASAEWAYSQGKKTAYVIDDGQTYGQGIGRAWALHFGKIGGKVVSANGSSESYDIKATDYQALAQKIKDSGADVVFIGAITGNNTAKLWKDIRAVNPTIAIFAPDGVNEKTWYTGTGAAGNGTFLTFGGVDISQLTGTGKTWSDAYKAANGGTQAPFYAAYGKAAAQVALAGLTAAGSNDRWAVLQAIMGSSGVDTVIGAVTFDPNGDAKGGVISSYSVDTGWPPTYKGVITMAQP
ncbi:MAG: branched-chain amino acid ABC transporter substrate-binding protein [Candidatus Limnocylindrales bacterium]